jgi:hypothetical protein
MIRITGILLLLLISEATSRTSLEPGTGAFRRIRSGLRVSTFENISASSQTLISAIPNPDAAALI